MANDTVFRLPTLGENIKGGDVVRVLVKPGDTVKKDQAVIELETDKATVEVPSDLAGTVSAVRVKEGDHIEIGAVLFELSAGSSEEIPTQKHRDTEKAGKAEAEAKVAAPVVPAARSEAAPSVAAAPAPVAVAVGSPSAVRSARPAGQAAPAGPGVRRLAREIGVEVSAVRGTGPGGRISEADVKAHAKALLSGGAAAPAPAGAGIPAVPLPDFSKYGPVERVNMNNVRRATAEHMTRAWLNVPHVTQHDLADVTQSEAARQKAAKEAAERGVKLTMTALIVQACAAALRKFPQFNASLDPAAKQIILKKYIHIGVAVDTPKGLLVPVVRDADKKGVEALAVEINTLAQKARDGKLSLDDMQGGCFSVTNLGGIGGTAFTPIVNAPEVAILGVSRSRVEAGIVNGVVQPRTVMPLSLSYDHRVIDGADAARFLRFLCEALENPFLLALGG